MKSLIKLARLFGWLRSLFRRGEKAASQVGAQSSPLEPLDPDWITQAVEAARSRINSPEGLSQSEPARFKYALELLLGKECGDVVSTTYSVDGVEFVWNGNLGEISANIQDPLSKKVYESFPLKSKPVASVLSAGYILEDDGMEAEAGASMPEVPTKAEIKLPGDKTLPMILDNIIDGKPIPNAAEPSLPMLTDDLDSELTELYID
jgi:hypothetical protein